MSIGVQCVVCGRRYRVREDRAGTTMTCQCGKSVAVDGPRYVDKVCIVCGIDVSSLTRTRDPGGNYYCQPCWAEAVKAKRVATAKVAEPELAWVTQQLSILSRRVWKPLVVALTLLLLVLSWFVPKLGLYSGATLLVSGGSLLAVCTVWLFVIPFRDGPKVGLACIRSTAQRRQWARRNPDFNLRRPASLALTGLIMVVLSLAFIAVAKTAGERRFEPSTVEKRV